MNTHTLSLLAFLLLGCGSSHAPVPVDADAGTFYADAGPEVDAREADAAPDAEPVELDAGDPVDAGPIDVCPAEDPDRIEPLETSCGRVYNAAQTWAERLGCETVPACPYTEETTIDRSFSCAASLDGSADCEDLFARVDACAACE